MAKVTMTYDGIGTPVILGTFDDGFCPKGLENCKIALIITEIQGIDNKYHADEIIE